MENFDQYYRSYKYMQKHLATDFTANYLQSNMADADTGRDVLSGKLHEKIIDMAWVIAIEETLPYIEKAIDEQRRFIVEHNEIYRIDKAKIINKDSVKHLIQHTNFIDSIDETGRVTPNKVLTIEREDSYETYENRFLITLIETALNFVTDKYHKLVDAPTDTYNKVEMERELVMNNQRITFKTEYSNEVKDAQDSLLDVKDYEKLSDFDRVRRIREKLNSFLNTDMMIALKKCIRVKPPINRTNLMTKNPNYKASLDLFLYLGSYNKPGYEIISKDFTGKMDKGVQEAVYFSQSFQHFMISIATNPALKKMLEDNYQERKKTQGAAGDSEIAAMIEAVRKEEMKLRLQEIRKREKIIRDQKAEIASLKREIEKRDRTIENLKSNIKMLEDQIKELQNEIQQIKAELIKAKERIAELEAKIEELEAKIAELEAKIEELNATIRELQKQIAALEDRVRVLLQENAEQQAKIKEQEGIIQKQTEQIAGLEEQVAAQQASISELESNVAKCEQKIREDEKQITTLTDQRDQLETTLRDERKDRRATEEKMKADHAEEIQSMEEAHSRKVKNLQQTIDDSEASHAKQIADMTADFAAKESKAEQRHLNELQQKQTSFEKQINSIKKNNSSAAAAAEAKHAAEIKKVQKSVDKRVEQAEKAAEKRMNEKVKEVQRSAGKKTSAIREEAKAIHGFANNINRDFTFGSVRLVSDLAQNLSQKGERELGKVLAGKANKIRSVTATVGKKGVVLSRCSSAGIKTEKLYKKTSDLHSALADVPPLLAGMDKTLATVSYAGVDRSVAEAFANQVKAAGVSEVSLSQNRNMQNCRFVSLYFFKD